MYSPSPPPAAASNAYMYVNPHSQNPYASMPPSGSQAGLMPGAHSSGTNGPSSSASYGIDAAYSGMGSAAQYPGSNMPWFSRPAPAQQQQAHLAQHHGTPSLTSLPPPLAHTSGAAVGPSSSPGYAALSAQSPATLSMMASGLSPTTPTAQQAAAKGTPSGTGVGVYSPEWQQQMVCAEISRQSYAPHHHARAAALAARSFVGSNDPKKGIQLPAGAAANGLSFPSRDMDESGRSAEDSISAMGTSPAKRSGAAQDGADEEEAQQTWTTVDMGGLNLKNIGAEVFRYSFLTSLFINHNRLTSLSPAIAQLRQLSVLDASGNKLTSLPPELGMLTGLKELFLFDNRLTMLPPELGTLFQLEMLGVEGNPLQENMLGLLQREGTHALIAFLRDSCPVPVPPPEREWVALDTGMTPPEDEQEDARNTFTVLSYNVLCSKYATPYLYGYTPSWALTWDYRKEFILQEIMGYGADICCLQEVEMGQYDEYFEPKMQQNQYEGLFWPKSRARTMRDDERRHVDGCAIFFNTRNYRLVEKQLIEFNQLALQRADFKKTEDIFNRVMTKDNIAAIAMLENCHTGARLIVANAHVHWDPEFRDVKLVQAAMLMEQLEQVCDRYAKMPLQSKLPEGVRAPKYASGTQVPMIVCGDFNSTPDSGVYEFLSQGRASPKHEDFMDHIYGSYTSEGLHHNFALRSAYGNLGELPFTNLTPGFRGVIDYIWYTGNSLAASGLLGEVDRTYLSRIVGFPNAHFPSDHVCMLAEFKVKPVQADAAH